MEELWRSSSRPLLNPICESLISPSLVNPLMKGTEGRAALRLRRYSEDCQSYDRGNGEELDNEQELRAPRASDRLEVGRPI